MRPLRPGKPSRARHGTQILALVVAGLFANAAACAAPTQTASQATQPAGFGKVDPAPPTGVSVDQLIQRMGARESAFSAARDDYSFRQTVTIDTINDDTGRPDGEYKQVTDISFDKDGKRNEHVIFAPQNTLENVILTTNDMDEVAHRLPFVLTTEQLPEYDITYVGRQRVDELDTYVLEIKPKTYEKGKHYVQGKVWVDQQDFEIVLVSGITVPQDTRKGHEDLSPPFTTYYEQIDGKYWFPTYTRGEGTLHFAAQDGALSQNVHLRSTVKYTDYKRFRTSVRLIFNGQDVTTPPPQNPPASQPKQP